MGDEDGIGVVGCDGGGGGLEESGGESGLDVLAELAVRIERHHRRFATVIVGMVLGIVGMIVVGQVMHSMDVVRAAIMGVSLSLGMFVDQWRSLLLARGASADALLRSAEIESMEHDQRVVARVASVIVVVVGFATLLLGSVQSWTGSLQGPVGYAAASIGIAVVTVCLSVIFAPRLAPSVVSHEDRQSSMVGVRLKGRGVDEVAAVRERERYLKALRAWREGEDGAG